MLRVFDSDFTLILNCRIVKLEPKKKSSLWWRESDVLCTVWRKTQLKMTQQHQHHVCCATTHLVWGRYCYYYLGWREKQTFNSSEHTYSQFSCRTNYHFCLDMLNFSYQIEYYHFFCERIFCKYLIKFLINVFLLSQKLFTYFLCLFFQFNSNFFFYILESNRANFQNCTQKIDFLLWLKMKKNFFAVMQPNIDWKSLFGQIENEFLWKSEIFSLFSFSRSCTICITKRK